MADKKIIVAYDGSDDSKKTLAMAADLAQNLAAKLFLVSVCEMPGLLAEGFDYSSWITDLKRTYAKKVEGAKKYCEERSLPVHTEVLEGHPATEIIKYAQQENACMIIAGTRGLGGFGQLLLGSVAHELVTYSDIPVLIVK